MSFLESAAHQATATQPVAATRTPIAEQLRSSSSHRLRWPKLLEGIPEPGSAFRSSGSWAPGGRNPQADAHGAFDQAFLAAADVPRPTASTALTRIVARKMVETMLRQIFPRGRCR